MNALLARCGLGPIVLLAVAAFAGGCGLFKGQPEIQVIPASSGGKVKLVEKFPAAFVARGSGGDYQIVLVQDGASKNRKPEPGTPVPPLKLDDVRQVLSIHVFWNPMRGTKGDSPSATNAAVDWYFFRAENDKLLGVARYEGAGLIAVEPDGDKATVKLRSATIRPTSIEGDIVDPLGVTTLSAKFDAEHNPAAVADVMSHVERLKAAWAGASIDPVKLTEPAAASVR